MASYEKITLMMEVQKLCVGVFFDENEKLLYKDVLLLVNKRKPEYCTQKTVEAAISFLVETGVLLYSPPETDKDDDAMEDDTDEPKEIIVKSDGMVQLSQKEVCFIPERRCIMGQLKQKDHVSEDRLYSDAQGNPLKEESLERMKSAVSMLQKSGLIRRQTNGKLRKPVYTLKRPFWKDLSDKEKLQERMKFVIQCRYDKANDAMRNTMSSLATSDVFEALKEEAHDSAGNPLLSEEEFDDLVKDTMDKNQREFDNNIKGTSLAPMFMCKEMKQEKAFFTNEKQEQKETSLADFLNMIFRATQE